VATYYADSSVLIKRHIAEVGSGWVASLTDTSSGNRSITAQITQVEGMSALNRRRREGVLSIVQYTALGEDWIIVCTTIYQLVSLSPQAVKLCQRLLETHSLRAHDAVQLASALTSNDAFIAVGDAPLVFLSADKRLLDAARGEGFVVDDPNNHP
jgi:predicted nucleic acid-binding protein